MSTEWAELAWSIIFWANVVGMVLFPVVIIAGVIVVFVRTRR